MSMFCYFSCRERFPSTMLGQKSDYDEVLTIRNREVNFCRFLKREKVFFISEFWVFNEIDGSVGHFHEFLFDFVGDRAQFSIQPKNIRRELTHSCEQ